MRYLLILTLLAFGCAGDGMPSEEPKLYADNTANTADLRIAKGMDVSETILVVKDEDRPRGMCDFGTFVRAVKAYREIPISWCESDVCAFPDGSDLMKNGKLMRALDEQLARCSPGKEKK